MQEGLLYYETNIVRLGLLEENMPTIAKRSYLQLLSYTCYTCSLLVLSISRPYTLHQQTQNICMHIKTYILLTVLFSHSSGVHLVTILSSLSSIIFLCVSSRCLVRDNTDPNSIGSAEVAGLPGGHLKQAIS